MAKLRVLGARSTTAAPDAGQARLRVLGARGTTATQNARLRVLGAKGSMELVPARLRVLSAYSRAAGATASLRVLGASGKVAVPTSITITASKTGNLETGESVTLTTNASAPTWQVVGGSAQLADTGNTCMVTPAANTTDQPKVTAVVQVTDPVSGTARTIELSSWPATVYVLTAGGLKPVARYVDVASVPPVVTPPPTGAAARKITGFGTLATNAMSSSATWYPQLRPEVAAVMDEWNWRTLQPNGPGAALDSTAVAARQAKWQQYKDGGFLIRKVGLGLHYEPAWTFAAFPLGSTGQDKIRFRAVSDGVYAQADGSDTLDGVWSAQVRDWYDDYLTRMAAVIPFSDIDVIRVTAGGRSEVLFPEQQSGRYWTGAEHVQNGGANLAAGQTPAPISGWAPATWTLAQRRAYVEWYLRSLVNAVVWQMNKCRSLGFTGIFEVTLPGRGMTVAAYESDISTGLPQSSVLSRGAAWHKIAEFLPADPRIRLWATSVGQAGPTDANRIPTDADYTVAVTDTAANSWGAFRWVRRLAKPYGYQIGGENPREADDSGYSNLTAAGLLARFMAEIAPADAEPADGADWAHADNLRTAPGLLAAYKSAITAVTPTTSPNQLGVATLGSLELA